MRRLVALLVCCLLQPALAAEPLTHPVELHRVLDGDTIDATLPLPFGLSLRPARGWRAADFDAIELREPRGKEAREFVANVAKNGVLMLLTKPRGEIDKYGRPLAVFLVRRDANDTEYVPLKELMIAQGFIKGSTAGLKE